MPDPLGRRATGARLGMVFPKGLLTEASISQQSGQFDV
jgi:hypothetical protein